MHTRRRLAFSAAALAAATPLLALGSRQALARDPNQEERAAIEAALRSQGYVSWNDIEWDDGRWEVDDARTADGRKYDLKLDPATLQVTSRDED